MAITERIRREYGETRSPNVGKYGPEKLRIQILFMQCKCIQNIWQKTTSINRKWQLSYFLSNSLNNVVLQYIIGVSL